MLVKDGLSYGSCLPTRFKLEVLLFFSCVLEPGDAFRHQRLAIFALERVVTTHSIQLAFPYLVFLPEAGDA